MERSVTTPDGERIVIREPKRTIRLFLYPWEYWAMKEHKAMKRCDTWIDYIVDVVMTTSIPIFSIEDDIGEMPSKDDEMRVITIEVLLKQYEWIDSRRRTLARRWREFMLYPSILQGLVADHYFEINGEEWEHKEKFL